MRSATVNVIRKALRESARPAKNLERFSLENVAGEYVALYERLRDDLPEMARSGGEES
jgi:hypothetical protein